MTVRSASWHRATYFWWRAADALRFTRCRPATAAIPTILMISVLCIATLPSCASQGTHPKVERYSTAPTAAKISVSLLHLDHRVRLDGMPLATAAADLGIQSIGNRVGLEVVVRPLNDRVARKFVRPGVVVHHVSIRHRRVSVMIEDLVLLYELARIPEVLMITPAHGATTHVGPVHQESDGQTGGALHGR